MYPTGELKRLAARRKLLSVRIDARRWQCIEHWTKLSRPLQWLDDLLAKWRRISPLVKIVGTPVILMLVRKLFGRVGQLGRLVSWLRLAPLVLHTARTVAQWTGQRGATASSR
jgi:hypothetical protein